MKYRYIIIFSIVQIVFTHVCFSQVGYGNNWVLGNSTSPEISGTIINFKPDSINIFSSDKSMFMHAANTSMSDAEGNLLFYSNGCEVADAKNNLLLNGGSIGHGNLATSFCNSIGSPLTQGILSLPQPGSDYLYYLFYLDLQLTYEFPTGLYFPFAPTNLYYGIIDMSSNNNMGSMVVKDMSVVSDTLSRGMLQAVQNDDGSCWWIVMPESHSNCYYTLKLTSNGIDTIFRQCQGIVWDDEDRTGQAVFSPNSKKYARSNYFNGLNIFDFDSNNGILSNPINIDFGLDTFYFSGAVFSPNSRFIYITAYNNIFQFDLYASDIAKSKILVAELNTPANISNKTRFNQALLAPNGKIYIGGTSSHNYLHIIQNPNCYGLNCNVDQYALEMPAFNLYGLPNIPCFGDWSEADICDSITNNISPNVIIDLKVFPNPFNNELHIVSKAQFILEIYDSFGRLVFRKQLDSAQNIVTLDFLLNGIYFYRVVTKHELIGQGKIVKSE